MTRRHVAALIGLALVLSGFAAASFGAGLVLGVLAAVAVVLSALALGGPRAAVFALVAVLAIAQFARGGNVYLGAGRGSHHATFHHSHWESYP